MVTMAGMSLSNLHSDLKLGLLLVVAVLFLEGGSHGGLWVLIADSELELTSVQYGLLTAAYALGSLHVVGAVIWGASAFPT